MLAFFVSYDLAVPKELNYPVLTTAVVVPSWFGKRRWSLLTSRSFETSEGRIRCTGVGERFDLNKKQNKH